MDTQYTGGITCFSAVVSKMKAIRFLKGKLAQGFTNHTCVCVIQ